MFPLSVQISRISCQIIFELKLCLFSLCSSFARKSNKNSLHNCKASGRETEIEYCPGYFQLAQIFRYVINLSSFPSSFIRICIFILQATLRFRWNCRVSMSYSLETVHKGVAGRTQTYTFPYRSK